MLMAVVVVGAVCARAFTPASQVTSATITAQPAVRTQCASVQETTINTAPRGLFIFFK